jgi:hypothetical protein
LPKIGFRSGQLKYCQKLDSFEADPNNKFKPLIKKTRFLISKSIKCPFITQLKCCQKMHFEAGPKNKLKALKTKKIGRTLIINTPGLTSFYYSGAKPTNGSFIFKLFSKGDQ